MMIPPTRFLRLLRLLPVIAALAGATRAADLAWLDRYNIVWTSPSQNSAGSMPCGGGDTGLNVWVENGDLLCYVQRSGSFDENNQYLKLGRLRLRLDPNPFADGGSFRQELQLRHGHDWVPDHNWGGSGMIGLQEMLMQTIGDRILLLPAWPADWDCDFKLHAPQNTVVSAKVRGGKITDLQVTPESRRKDVVVHQP